VVVEHGKALNNDCGTTALLSDVTETGEVVYAHADRDRMSTECGGKADVNRWNFVGVSLSGETRTIFSSATPVRSHNKVFDGSGYEGSCDCDAGWRSVTLSGDWALVESFDTTLLLNLVTGFQSASYLPAGFNRHGFAQTSIDAQGHALQHAVTITDRGKLKKRRYKNTYKTLLFTVPGDPSVSMPLQGNPYTLACGDGFYSIVPTKNKRFVISQLDATSGVVLRVVGQIGSKFGIDSCDAKYLYAGHNERRHVIYRAIPLG
jgi:hypothetical protein